MTTVSRAPVPEGERATCAHTLFGSAFAFRLEPVVFKTAEMLSRDYRGGYWQFFTLSNGGFYLAPDNDKRFVVACDNGNTGTLSADALGITACLYAYSNLSFSGSGSFPMACADHYHLLREYTLGHAEAGEILAAID